MNSMLHRARQSNYLRNILIMFRGTIIGQLVPILAFPVLSRLYSPAIIGEYAVVFALASILGGIAGMRLEMALVTAEAEDREGIVKFIFIVMLPLVVIFIALSFWVGRSFSISVLQFPEETILYLFLLTLMNCCFNTLLFYNSSLERFKINSNSRVLLAAGTIIIQIGVGAVVGATVLALFIGRILALAMAAIYLSQSLDLFRVLGSHYQGLCKTISNYSLYYRFYWPASFIDMTAFHMPIILIGSLFNQSMAGQYSFAYRGISVPSATIGQAVSQVFFKKFTDQFQFRGEHRKTLVGTWAVLAAIGIVPFTVLFLFGRTLVPLILGADWEMAGEIVRIISPMAFIMFVSAPTSAALLTLKGQRLTLIFSTAQLSYKSFALYHGFIQNDLLMGITVFVICHSIQIIVYNLTIIYLIEKQPDNEDPVNT